MVSTDIITELLRAIGVARGAMGAKASRALLQTTIATILPAASEAETHAVSRTAGDAGAEDSPHGSRTTLSVAISRQFHRVVDLITNK
jgi:hypothetical protein